MDHLCLQLPFSTVASLSTVAMFCKNQGTQLISTEFEDGLIIWKEFERRIIIIGIGRGYTESAMFELIDLTFHAMVLCVGIDELRAIQNLDRLKRDLKVSFQVIEVLMEAVEKDLLMYNDSILCAESGELSNKLNEYATQIKSPYACLLMNQRIVCASDAWWCDLDVIDRKLLIILYGIMTTAPKEMPVFVPIQSPQLAYRFIVINMTSELAICMLCGPEPSFLEIENITRQWMGESELLSAPERWNPRSFCDNLILDPAVQGFLLINDKTRRYVISKNVQSNTTGKKNSGRLNILRQFFQQAIQVVQQMNFSGIDEGDTSAVVKNKEQYWAAEYYKCHGLIDGDNTLCVLYASVVSTPVMRLMTKRLFETLLTDRDTCWQLYQ